MTGGVGSAFQGKEFVLIFFDMPRYSQIYPRLKGIFKIWIRHTKPFVIYALQECFRNSHACSGIAFNQMVSKRDDFFIVFLGNLFVYPMKAGKTFGINPKWVKAVYIIGNIVKIAGVRSTANQSGNHYGLRKYRANRFFKYPEGLRMNTGNTGGVGEETNRFHPYFIADGILYMVFYRCNGLSRKYSEIDGSFCHSGDYIVFNAALYNGSSSGGMGIYGM